MCLFIHRAQNGTSSLRRAAYRGFADCIRVLVEGDADIEDSNRVRWDSMAGRFFAFVLCISFNEKEK